MIPEIGQFALILAFVTAIYQFAVPMYGAWRGDSRLMAVAPPAALLQFGLIALAFACLTWSYVSSDFSVENVFQNSHSDKPLIYKISVCGEIMKAPCCCGSWCWHCLVLPLQPLAAICRQV